MAQLLAINGRVYELESPGYLCLGFCLFDGSYPAYDEPPQRLSVPYAEIRARTPRLKDELQQDLDNLEDYVRQVQHQLSHIKEPLDKLTEQQWIGYRSKLVELVERLDQIPGISVSVATKILHRHFPQLMPIVDELCVKVKHGYRGKIGEILDSIRRDMILSQSAIDEALSFLLERLGSVPLTRVRVFDIFLWSIMNADNKKIRGVYSKRS